MLIAGQACSATYRCLWRILSAHHSPELKRVCLTGFASPLPPAAVPQLASSATCAGALLPATPGAASGLTTRLVSRSSPRTRALCLRTCRRQRCSVAAGTAVHLPAADVNRSGQQRVQTWLLDRAAPCPSDPTATHQLLQREEKAAVPVVHHEGGAREGALLQRGAGGASKRQRQRHLRLERRARLRAASSSTALATCVPMRRCCVLPPLIRAQCSGRPSPACSCPACCSIPDPQRP